MTRQEKEKLINEIIKTSNEIYLKTKGLESWLCPHCFVQLTRTENFTSDHKEYFCPKCEEVFVVNPD